MDNRPVKIYQTFSPVHAEYVEQVSQDSVLCQYFPQVMRRWNEYLVVEWIAGKSLNAEKVVKNRALLQEMVGLQAAIHSRTFPGTSGSFSYLSYLHDRLLRYIGPFVQSDGICQIIDLIQNHAPGQLDACVSHPDVTPNNLVIEETSGRLKLVDNEALTQSWYYLIDLFNTYYSLDCSEEVAHRYIEFYQMAGGDASMLLEHSEFFVALWSLRVIGSTLQAGDVEQAFRLADRWKNDGFRGHPLIKATERTFA